MGVTLEGPGHRTREPRVRAVRPCSQSSSCCVKLCLKLVILGLYDIFLGAWASLGFFSSC